MKIKGIKMNNIKINYEAIAKQVNEMILDLTKLNLKNTEITFKGIANDKKYNVKFTICNDEVINKIRNIVLSYLYDTESFFKDSAFEEED